MDFTPIFQALIALAGAIVTCVLVPYLKSKYNQQQREEINGWVATAVLAAEQIYKGSGRGEEKKLFVLDWLEEHGIDVDETVIDAAVEAAVYRLKEGLL